MPSGDSGGDSGVSKRLLGTFLTEMNDITEPIFWVFTSNDVATVHEAFLRAERIDAKIYVRLPDESQRADVWRIYVKKFFPEKVGGEADPRHIGTDVAAMLAAYSKLKKVSPVEAGEKFAVALMGVPAGQRRDEVLDKIEAVDPNLASVARKGLIDDEGWTPAEIRSCCRLKRRLNMTLLETSKRIGHVCLGSRGEKMLARLDKWAQNDGAIDAETGEMFVPLPAKEEEEEEREAAPRDGARRARRKMPAMRKNT